MESLSRPPHKRKHSRRPYDDVFLSNAAERGTLEAHEYAEIFSGSSSIPVLDLSGLDEQFGPGDPRSSDLDYSRIFGGFTNDDVALPYEELFSSSAKKTQLRKQADVQVTSREFDSLHSNGNLKINSVEASDQSADESKKQFNVSFNKTHHQRSINTSDGKTHIAQLQAVPSFTHFVNETSQISKTDTSKPVNSLKRDVSRTWSFSAKSDFLTGKDEISREKPHIPEIKPQPSASDFVPEQDASEKNAAEFSSPFYVEDFEENSVAAASAAALKRAIDQAQESIRLAKMIMDRKKEGCRNGSEARKRDIRRVLDRDSKMNNSMEKYAELDPTKFVIGIDGKYSASLIHNGAINSAAKVEVESVCKNAAEGKGRGMVLSNDSESFPSNDAQNIELEKTEENVDAVEVHGGGADISVILTNECKTANLEQRDESVDRAQGPKVVAEHVERAHDTSSERIQELERKVEEAEVCNATFDNAGPGNKVESVLTTPQRTRRQWKDSEGAGEYFGISQNGVFEEGENDVDDKGMKDSEEVINVERSTELRSDLDSGIISETSNLGKNEIERESERNENGYIWETYYDESNLWFESEEQLKEALEKEIEPVFFPEIEVDEERVDEAHEPEIYKQKENHAHDGDEQILPEEIVQSDVEERDMSTFEHEVPETIEVGEINCAPVQSSAGFYNSEKNRENCQYEENHYEEHINEPVDVNSGSSSTIFSEIRAACNVDLDNNSEDYQTVVENHTENYTMPEVIETFSETKKDKEVEHMFHQEDGSEIPRAVSSKDIFSGNKLHNDFDILSSDGSEMENVCVMGAGPEEDLPEDKGAFNTSKTPEFAQEFTFHVDLPQIHSSDIRTGSDPEDVRLVAEEASGSDEGSVPTSSHENINVFSAHDSEECEENANDVTPNNEELKDELDLVPKERMIAEGKTMESEGAGERGPIPNAESNKENLAGTGTGTSPAEKKDAKIGDPHNPDKDDYQQRIDAIKRGREREKDRKVVERAIREARERAFIEARERAERASVEKASAEAQQRALEKASRVKLRAERAAVERATAEARERALEKALSLKATHIEGRTSDKVSGSSGVNGLKHSFSSSDLGNETESAQRRKARLERHQRIMDRAAKALAEKNMRDIVAQKEQAERNRLAEYLDADIKRWATGKEKNLRALLSTLQYILGPDSGWQAIPLTDIITSAAVKKAYRKATLCVHPDKLQQRGATIKQKYICEKVFDLLKAAWNRFNSDER